MEKTYKRLEYSNENFRKNINYLIKRDNITKSFIDKELELGDGALSRYCKLDSIEPGIGKIDSLAKAFGITIDDLINGDIEVKEKELLESNQRPDILFAKKLIEQTKQNQCKWEKLDIYNDSHIYVTYCEERNYYDSNLLNPNGKFESKFIYEANEADGFIVMINSNIKVFLTKYDIFLGGKKDFALNSDKYIDNYELYLINQSGEVIPSFSSYRYQSQDSKLFGENIIYDKLSDDVLQELYNVVSYYIEFGKDVFEKERIYEEYLYGVSL